MSEVRTTAYVDVVFNKEAAKRDVDEVTSLWARARNTIQGELRLTMRTISNVISVVRNTFAALGISLDPIQEALLAVIGATISTIVSINMALAAGSGGVMTGLSVAFAIAGLEMTAMAQLKAMSGMNDAKSNMNDAARTLDSLSNLFMNFTRW